MNASTSTMTGIEMRSCSSAMSTSSLEPMSSRLTTDEMAYIVEDSGARAIVT